jgi:signal transduction histidine kinase
VIRVGPTPPTPEQPFSDRRGSPRAVELLPRVLEALPVGIGLFELHQDDFRFRYGNRAFSRVLMLDRMPADGESVDDVFRRNDQDAIVELFRLVRVSREPQTYFATEGVLVPAGNQIWNIDAYPVFTAGRVTYIMVLVEQADEKLQARQREQLEANRLREKADHLASLEHAKSEFLRLASHELRAPAAMLGGYLSMIEDESLGAIPERLRPVLPLLRAKAAQINLLANEMVEAARLEDGRLELKRKRVDLRELLRRSLKAAESTATPMHRLRFDDRIGHELWVLGDPMRLEIVIGNLLDNAIKYSPQGGEVLAHLSVSDGLAMLSVRDEGIGIAAEDMSRLFVRFSRLAPYGDVPGTGLGLYLVRELARLHGGDIVAVSMPGKGSEFTLSLPLEPRKK